MFFALPHYKIVYTRQFVQICFPISSIRGAEISVFLNNKQGGTP